MNGKTARLLHRYAIRTGKNIKELKRQWERSSWKERTEQRLQMQKEAQEK